MENYLRVGVIANTHGIKGELKVFPTTDDIKRFKKLDRIFVDMERKGLLPLKVEGVRFFKNMAILKLEGIDRIEDALLYKGRDLLVDREHAVPLENDEYFFCDLVGARVITEDGALLGTVDAILETGANDVYVVKREGEKDLLLPVIKDCVLSVDTEKGEVVARLLPGLLDL